MLRPSDLRQSYSGASGIPWVFAPDVRALAAIQGAAPNTNKLQGPPGVALPPESYTSRKIGELRTARYRFNDHGTGLGLAEVASVATAVAPASADGATADSPTCPCVMNMKPGFVDSLGSSRDPRSTRSSAGNAVRSRRVRDTTGVTAQDPGDVRLGGFLVDMAKVFEDFLTVARTEALRPHGGWCRAQDRCHLDVDDLIAIRPDLVRYRGGMPLAVMDAKYKAEKPAGFPDADLYQMLAYDRSIGSKPLQTQRRWISGTYRVCMCADHPLLHVRRRVGR